MAYSIERIKAVMGVAESLISKEQAAGLRKLTDERRTEIFNMLGSAYGVTRKKISDNSQKGFRDCLMACIDGKLANQE